MTGMSGWRCATMAAAWAAALAAAGCGSASTSEPATSASPGTPAGSRVTLVARDFAFEPSSLVLPPDTQVSLTLKNQGKAEHSFTTLSGASADVDADGGESATVSLRTPASGTIAFHCKYHPARMTGAITIGGAGAAAPAPSGSASESSPAHPTSTSY